ncbi:MAG: hypothetical protein ABIH23_02910 [bacterium]
MARRKKQKVHYLDPEDISVEIPLLELVQLEVSLLKLIQTLHEAGVAAVHNRMSDMASDDDPDYLLETAIDMYNEILEKQQEALDAFLGEDLELDNPESLVEEEIEEMEQIILESDKDRNSQTLH